jgi:hypothetical protein
MPNVKVAFDSIAVHNDGEFTQKGKIYWKLSVNGTKVDERTSGNPLLVASGSTIDLNSSRSVELADNQELVVNGFVAEKDSLTSGKDDTASFERSYDRSENWGDGVRNVRLTDSPLDCTLTYTIQAE